MLASLDQPAPDSLLQLEIQNHTAPIPIKSILHVAQPLKKIGPTAFQAEFSYEHSRLLLTQFICNP